MLLYVIAVALAIVLDALFILAWRHKRRTGQWPRWQTGSIKDRFSSIVHDSRDYFLDFLIPSDRIRAPGWRGRIPELSLLGSLLLLVGYVLLLRPTPAAPNGTESIAPWLAWMGALRESAVTRAWTWATLLAIGLAFYLTSLASRNWGSARFKRAFGLGLALWFAVEAQLALANGVVPLGLLLYVAMAFSLWLWWRRYGQEHNESRWQRPPGRRAELAIVLAVFVISASARLYQVGQQPYGVEGDESKWTIEVVHWMLDGQGDSSADYHYNSLPVSFFMQAPFQRIIGPGILAARVTVALASVLASLLFYLLLRRTVGSWVALLGFFLLSISPADVVASRLANVESHVKLWAVLPLFLLYLAIDQRHVAWFGLSGISLALALITYDTLAPLLILAAFLFTVEAIRSHKDGMVWWRGLLAMAIPVSLTLPGAIDYLSGRSQYYSLASRGWGTKPWITLVNHTGAVLKGIFIDARPDFLIVRSGPLLEHAIAPFFVMGLVIALLRLKSRGPLLLVSWWFVFNIPVPIALNATMFRVIYPGWPAFYGLAALAIVLCFGELVVPYATKRALQVGLAIGASLLLTVNNLFTYLYVLEDPQDRVNRRLASELVLSQVRAGHVVYTPFEPDSGHVLQDEQNLIRLYLRSHLDLDEIDRFYRPLEMSELLHSLTIEPPENSAAVLFYQDREKGSDVVDGLQRVLGRCLGGLATTRRSPFTVGILDASGIEDADCAAPLITLDTTQSGSEGAVKFAWSSDYPLTDPALSCESLRPGIYLLTGQDFSLGSGWREEAVFAPLLSSKPFLADDRGTMPAAADLQAPANGPYAVWFRSYRRRADDWPGYVRVGGESMEFATLMDHLDEWSWERVGTVADLGDGRVRLSRPYGGKAADFYSLFVDSVLFTRDLAFDPTQQPLWQTRLQVPTPGGNPRGGSFFHVLDRGTYRCRILAAGNGRLVDAWGQSPAASESVQLKVSQPTP